MVIKCNVNVVKQAKYVYKRLPIHLSSCVIKIAHSYVFKTVHSLTLHHVECRPTLYLFLMLIYVITVYK